MEILSENASEDVSSVNEQLLIAFDDIHVKSNYISNEQRSETNCDRLTLFTSSALENENSLYNADLEKNKKTNKKDRRDYNVNSNLNIDKVRIFFSFFLFLIIYFHKFFLLRTVT